MGSEINRLLLLCTLAIVARLLFLGLFGGLDNKIHDSMSDQFIYLDLAKNLATGRGFTVSADTWIADPDKPTAIFPPLYPLFMSLNFKIFGESLIIIRLMHILLSLTMVIVVYLIGCRLFNQSIGLIAGLIVALYPPLVMYVRPIMSEGIFFPLVALLIWVTYQLDQSPTKLLYPVWGLIAGLAILTRTEIVILVGLLLCYLIFRHLKKIKITEYGLRFGLLLFSLSLTLLPYALYNYSTQGRFSPLPNAKWKFWDHTWWSEMREHPEWAGVSLPERRLVPNWTERTEVERDAYLWNTAIQFVRENPKIFLVQRVKRLFLSYPLIPREELPPPWGKKGLVDRPDGYEYGPTSLDDVLHYITPAEKIRVWIFRLITILAVSGIFLLLYRRQQNAYWLLLVLLWNIIHSMLFVGSERLRLQIDPYLILFAAFFLNFVWAHLTLKIRAKSELLTEQVVSADSP